MTSTKRSNLFAAVTACAADRLGTPIWATGATPDDALLSAERDGGLDPETLWAVPVGPRLRVALDRGHYAPETRWGITNAGVAELAPAGETAYEEAVERSYATATGQWEGATGIDCGAIPWVVEFAGHAAARAEDYASVALFSFRAGDATAARKAAEVAAQAEEQARSLAGGSAARALVWGPFAEAVAQYVLDTDGPV